MKTTYLLCILFLLNVTTYAQQGFVSAGGDIKNSSGSISSSIGQVTTAYTKNTSHSINQGIQQVYSEQSTAIKSNIHLKTELFPNPSSDYIFLHVDHPNLKGMSFTVFNINGQRMTNTKKLNEKNKVTLTDYVSGLYTLNIQNNNQIIQSIKFIKQ